MKDDELREWCENLAFSMGIEIIQEKFPHLWNALWPDAKIPDKRAGQEQEKPVKNAEETRQQGDT